MIGSVAKTVVDAVAGVLPKKGAHGDIELRSKLPERSVVVSDPNAEHLKFVAAQLPFVMKDIQEREEGVAELSLDQGDGLDSLQKEVRDRLSTLKVTREFGKSAKNRSSLLGAQMGQSYAALYGVIKMLAPLFSRLRNFVSAFRLSSNMKQ